MSRLRMAVEFFVCGLVVMIASPFLAVLGQTISRTRGELVVVPDDWDDDPGTDVDQ